MTDNAPGWQSDPTGRHDHRYWDGTAWTDNVSDAGVASTDAYAADADAISDAAPPEPANPVEPVAPVEPIASGWADPTTVSTAASDPTATWPTSPAPPAPPSYTPPAPPTAGGPVGPVGSGGSRKGLFIGIGVLAAVAIAVAVLLMGGGDDKSDVRALLASKLQAEEDTLSGDQAECVADLLVDEAGEDAFEDADFTADDPPEAFIDAFIAVGPDEFVDKCGIDESTFTGSGGDDSIEDDPSVDDGGVFPTDGELPADFEEQVADAYETSLGLDRDKAECLAGKIADAVNSGELDEEQAMSEIFEYLSDCDIDMSEISGN